MRLSIYFFFFFLAYSTIVLSQNIAITCEWSAGGDGDDDRFWGIDHVVDDRFVLVGNTNSSGTEGGNIPAFYGGRDAVLAFVDNCQASAGRYGGGGDDYFRDVITTQDNRIIAVGWSTSNEGHASGNNGGEDGWIIEFDGNSGGYVTSNQIGGSEDERFYAVKELGNGFAAVGKKPSQVNNSDDLWVVRVNESFNDNWQTRIGSLGEDILYDLEVAPNGDIIVVGTIAGDDGELASLPLTDLGGSDLVVARLDGATGAIEWIKSYGGTGEDQGFSIVSTTNQDGYIITGTSNSSSGPNIAAFDSDQPARGQRDLWILKIDQNGDDEWFKRYGGNEDEAGRDIIAVDGGKYVIASYAESNAVPVNFSYPSENRGDRDYWLITINENGDAIGGATFGGPGSDQAQAVASGPGIDYLAIVGFSQGGGQVSTHYGGEHDGWVTVVQEELVEIDELTSPPFYLKLYPNPISGSVLKMAWPDEHFSNLDQLTITNAIGQKVIARSTMLSSNKAEIDITSWKPGVYYFDVYLESKKTFVCEKVVVF